MSWWERHRRRFGGEWDSKIEAFAVAECDYPTECKRRVGRYALWCLCNDRDPSVPNETLMGMYVDGTPKLEGDGLMADPTQQSVRQYVSNWQGWLQR